MAHKELQVIEKNDITMEERDEELNQAFVFPQNIQNESNIDRSK